MARRPKTPVVSERAPLRWLLAAVVAAPLLLCLLLGAESAWIPALGTVGVLVPAVLLSAGSIQASEEARLVAAGRVAQAHDRAYDAVEARSRYPMHRVRAAEAIGEMSLEQSTPSLLLGLDDPDPLVRRRPALPPRRARAPAGRRWLR